MDKILKKLNLKTQKDYLKEFNEIKMFSYFIQRMNFKNIQKFLKKNYKKIIVVCLIMLLFSNKISENFTPTEALAGVKVIEKKVNDMFYEVDANLNKSSKGIYSQKSIEAEENVNAKKDVNANRLCLGGTCITKAHLDILNGKRHFFIANKNKTRFLKQSPNTTSYKAEWAPSWADEMKRVFIYTSGGRTEPNA